MPFELVIPKLGMTMQEGTVTEWLVADGAEVVAEQPLYRLTTEKLDHEEAAPVGGRLVRLVPDGTTAPTGARIGWLLAPGEAVPADGPGPAPAVVDRVPQPTAPRNTVPDPATDAGRVVASPVARRLAAELGVDLATVTGTGPGGRIVRDDVEAAAARPAATAPARPAAPEGTIVALTPMRRVIAERMVASLQGSAQLTMGIEVAAGELVRLRAQLVEEWAPEGIRPGYTDLVVRAAAKALRRHPALNARLTDDGVELLGRVDVGVAVALDGPPAASGLVVPVVRDADRLAVRELAAETARLAGAARAGTLGPDDVAGATFSVTALGAHGVDFFTPILNPPNVAILGIGAIRDGLRWDGDRPTRQPVLTLSLTVDHRVVDGVPGAAFLATVRALLEAPYRLLV